MDNVYSLTDQTVHPFTGAPMPKKEHQRLMTSLLAGILVIAVIIGVWYWISVVSNPPVTPTAGKQDIAAEMAALLRSEPVRTSQADVKNMASLLVKSKLSVTKIQQQEMASRLVQ